MGRVYARRQQRREWLRLEAARRFAAGDGTGVIARDLRVTPGSVRRWRRAWAEGGEEALRSQGPGVGGAADCGAVGALEAELRRGPLAYGFADDQRWTLGRIQTLTGWLFHVGYTLQGVWKLLRRQNRIITTHPQLGAPVIWCWDNLNIHLAPELAAFATENKDWLRLYRLPAVRCHSI